MDIMITADDTLNDNQWWKNIFRLYAKTGEYFEIHCWSDEVDALSAAEIYGSPACFSIPNIKIIHGTLTERLIRLFTREEKPGDCTVYNKMIPYFTIRIGNHYSSEKYGTVVQINLGNHVSQEQIDQIMSGVDGSVKIVRCD